jgi:putative transposase
MPRSLRLHVPDGFYHVTLRGNHQQNIFFRDCDRGLLNIIVARALEKFDTRLHAYCWMSNHLHLLLQVGAEPLGKCMRQIAAEFARAMQSKLQTTGHFFERRYHASLIEADSYLLEVVRYIHRNPIEAGIAADPGAYPWSSHHEYAGVRAQPWVSTGFVLRMFSADRQRAIAEYRAFVARADAVPGLKKIGDPDARITILGSDEFIAKVRRTPSHIAPCEGLEGLIEEACDRFAVNRQRLCSPVRDPYHAKVRAWVARQAMTRGIATLSAVARYVGRNEATLRQAMATLPHDLE